MADNLHKPAREFFNEVRATLQNQYDEREARSLAIILFDHFASLGLKDLIRDPEAGLSRETSDLITNALERLLKHEPVQYITGISHFCGYEFRVNPDVLIPRPETEELVRWVLEDNSNRHSLRIADIGTGSGCIAISLWLRFQDAEVHAFDFSEPALKVAAKNNIALGAEVMFRQVDFLNRDEWPAEKYDIIVSNPPYIPNKNMELLPQNVSRFEPSIALFVPDHDPLIFYHLLAEFSNSNLNPGGNLYVEVHEHYAEQVSALFAATGLSNIELRLDIHGRKRMVRASR